MSWSKGSEVMTKIIVSAVTHIEDHDVRVLFFEEIANTFWQDFDCDTLDECEDIDPAFDEALENIGYNDEDDYEDREWDEGTLDY